MSPLLAAPAARPPAAMVAGRMPLLDAAPYLRGEAGALEALAAELRFALEEVGFYLLTGHGIGEEQVARIYDQARLFHDLPAEAKLAIRINEHNVGYMPIKGTISRSSAVNANTRPNLNAAFFARRERTPDDPDVLANKPLRGLNQWPTGQPGFREACLDHMAAITSLGQRMVPVYARALGLVPGYFDAAFARPNQILRLSHYPAVAGFEDNEFSLAPHTDSGFMTLLPPNTVPGLAVRLPEGVWFEVPHVPGAFTVNSGDMLHRWSNEVFRSTPHRVQNLGRVARYATPFFLDPHPDTMIECLPSCTGPGRPPKQPPILFDDYIIWYAKKNYLHQQQEKQPAA